jgi:hypothetical protein
MMYARSVNYEIVLALSKAFISAISQIDVSELPLKCSRMEFTLGALLTAEVMTDTLDSFPFDIRMEEMVHCYSLLLEQLED